MFGMFSTLEVWLNLITAAIRSGRNRLQFVGVFYDDKFNTQLDITYKEEWHCAGSLFINAYGEPMTGSSELERTEVKQAIRDKKRLKEVQMWYG